MSAFTDMLAALFSRPIIRWGKPKPDGELDWNVTREGKLTFAGRDMTPLYPRTKAEFEKAYLRMKEKIAASGHPIVIKALSVERHVAVGLFNEGAITHGSLAAAVKQPHWLETTIELAGDIVPLRIVTGTYYIDYEFIVDGHPEGFVRVRDIPDALAVMAEEKAF